MDALLLASTTAVENVFIGCAALGGALFLVRLILMLMGGAEGDVDGDVGDFDVDADAGGYGDSDVDFQFLTVQGITAFFMMFGLVGLAMLHTMSDGPTRTPWSFGAATGAGVFSLLLMGKLTATLFGLQSSGTLDLRNAIGQEGTVYLTIREGSTGKVRVEVQGRLKVFEARSADGSELKTDCRVRVTGIVSGNVFVVESVE
jgi:hypothetical protein